MSNAFLSTDSHIIVDFKDDLEDLKDFTDLTNITDFTDYANEEEKLETDIMFLKQLVEFLGARAELDRRDKRDKLNKK